MTYPKDLDTRIKQLEVSIEYHCKALSHCPKDFAYRPDIESSHTEEYAQLGHCYYQANYPTKAIRPYLHARATDPNHFQAIYHLAMSYYQLKQFEEARSYFHEIDERVQFEYDRHHQIDAWFGIAITYIDEGKENSFKKAEKYLSLIRTTSPNHPTLQIVHEKITQQQRIVELIKQVRQNLANQQWIKANTALRTLKQLAPQHPETTQLEQTLNNIVSNHALTSYPGAMFNIRPTLHTAQTNTPDFTDIVELGF